MGHSFTQMNVHLIFATHQREPWLAKNIRPRAFAYMAEVARDKGASNVTVGGHLDHAQLLFELSPTVALADAARDIKANSSRWILATLRINGFRWQEGYTAFSVSRSLRDRVRRYIEGQEEHHQAVSLIDEGLAPWATIESPG